MPKRVATWANIVAINADMRSIPVVGSPVTVPEIVLVMISAVTTVLLQETLKAGNLRRTQANLIALGDEIFRVAVANVAQRGSLL